MEPESLSRSLKTLLTCGILYPKLPIGSFKLSAKTQEKLNTSRVHATGPSKMYSQHYNPCKAPMLPP